MNNLVFNSKTELLSVQQFLYETKNWLSEYQNILPVALFYHNIALSEWLEQCTMYAYAHTVVYRWQGQGGQSS